MKIKIFCRVCRLIQTLKPRTEKNKTQAEGKNASDLHETCPFCGGEIVSTEAKNELIFCQSQRGAAVLAQLICDTILRGMNVSTER